MVRFLIALALCVVTSHAYAVPGVTGLYNTGVDNFGNALPVSTADPHWSLLYFATPSGLPAVSMTPHFAWVDPVSVTPDARWIGPVSSPSTDPQFPNNVFTYSLSFNIDPSVNLTTLGLVGNWASDNQSGIWLNGLYTGNFNLAGTFEGGDGSYANLKPFNLTSGFQHGPNSLQFILFNDSIAGGAPGYLNPTGLLVSDLASVPEPGSIVFWGLFGVIGGVAYMTRRKMLRT